MCVCAKCASVDRRPRPSAVLAEARYVTGNWARPPPDGATKLIAIASVTSARRRLTDRRSGNAEERSDRPRHVALDHIPARRAPWHMRGQLLAGAFRNDEEFHMR